MISKSASELISLNPIPANQGTSSNLVIAEVLYDAVGTDTNLEWIVLYNPTNTTVDISNYKVQTAGSSFNTQSIISSNNSIKPYSYFLIAETLTGSGINADFVTGAMDFQNGGSSTDGIRILDSSDQIVDTLLYDSPNTNNLPDNTGNPGTSFAIDVSAGRSLKRKSNSSGYVEGQGNGYQTDKSGDDFLSNAVPTPKNSNSSIERIDTIDYIPTWISTDKRGESTSIGYWQTGSTIQHGVTYSPVYRVSFDNISDLSTDGITGIKIWGISNEGEDAPIFPLTYLLEHPILDIYLKQLQFVDINGEGVDTRQFYNITGYKKIKHPINY
jgi:hypothetical protein